MNPAVQAFIPAQFRHRAVEQLKYALCSPVWARAKAAVLFAPAPPAGIFGGWVGRRAPASAGVYRCVKSAGASLVRGSLGSRHATGHMDRRCAIGFSASGRISRGAGPGPGVV